MPPQAMRARCSGFRYCPDPLGIVTAEQFDKLEYISLFVFGSEIFYFAVPVFVKGFDFVLQDAVFVYAIVYL